MARACIVFEDTVVDGVKTVKAYLSMIAHKDEAEGDAPSSIWYALIAKDAVNDIEITTALVEKVTRSLDLLPPETLDPIVFEEQS